MSTVNNLQDYATSAALLEEPPIGLEEFTKCNETHPQNTKNTKVLLSNVIWMLVGNVAYGFSQWTLLVALAKLGTVEMVGNFGFAMAIVLPVLMFSSLSLRSLQITDAVRSYRFLEYGALRFVTLVLSLVFIFVFALVTRSSAVVFVSTLLIGGAKAFEYASDILYGLLQQEEDMSGIAISMLLRSGLSIVALSTIVYLTHSLVWASAGLLLCSAAVLLGYDIPKAIADRKTRWSTEFRNSVKYVRELIKFENQQRLWKLAMAGLPMGFALMMVSLNLTIPRYFIERRLGMAELGIFAAISTLLASGSVAINAVGQAAAPRLAKAFAARDGRKFAMLLAALVVASLGLGGLGLLGAALFGKQAMAAIYRPEYSTHHDVLLWLMAASGLYYLGSTLGYAVTAVRCFSPQMPLFIGAAGTTAIGCLLLIPYMGLSGAAIAILISSFVQCLGSIFLLFLFYRKATTSVGAQFLSVEQASFSN